jgi:hypothetical protein
MNAAKRPVLITSGAVVMGRRATLRYGKPTQRRYVTAALKVQQNGPVRSIESSLGESVERGRGGERKRRHHCYPVIM